MRHPSAILPYYAERPCKRCVQRNIQHLCRDMDGKRRGRKGVRCRNESEHRSLTILRAISPERSRTQSPSVRSALNICVAYRSC